LPIAAAWELPSVNGPGPVYATSRNAQQSTDFSVCSTGASPAPLWSRPARQLLRTDPASLPEAHAGQGIRRRGEEPPLRLAVGQLLSECVAIRYTGNQATVTPAEVRSYRPLTFL
jgi:hypothetical protein